MIFPLTCVSQVPLGYLTPLTLEDVFCNDVPKELVKEAISHLKPVSQTALSSPAGLPEWADPGFNERLAYIRTSQDNGIPAFAQNGMMAASGASWDVYEFETGHSPFLSQPEQLSKTIISLVEKWKAQFRRVVEFT